DPNEALDQTTRPSLSQMGYADRFLAMSGYLLIGAAVLSFGAVVVMKVLLVIRREVLIPASNWVDLVQQESGTIALLFIGWVAASLGKRLLTSLRLVDTRTIPYEDLPLVRRAVIDGKSEPIHQYVRLRSLSGMSGNFTKLGVTGLPLTTVFLTLVFSCVSLL